MSTKIPQTPQNPLILPITGIARLLLLFGVVGVAISIICLLAMSLTEDGWYNLGHPQERRAEECKSKLRQIGRAMEIYRKVHGVFPPSYTVDAEGRKMHSWRALLLPYLELTGEDELLKKYDFDQPWDSPHNQQFVDRMPYVYWCTAERKDSMTTTNYVAVVGKETLFTSDRGRSIQQVADRIGETIAVVEIVKSNIPWLEPRDLEFDEMTLRLNDPGGHDPSSKHVSSVHVLMADGSVVELPEGTSPAKLRAMLTVDGGEKVEAEVFRQRR